MGPASAGRLCAAVVALALLAAGCATRPPVAPESAAPPAAGSVLRSVEADRALEERILALDPDRVSAEDVRDTLSKAPAPHIVLIHGGIFPVHLAMVSFGRFLAHMGYPEDRIRHPGDRRWSHSPYEDSTQIAGVVAWYYEHEGVRPMLIGHSQGGVQAVKVLYEFAGRYADALAVWNPHADAAEGRTTIVDPLTGEARPVVGLSVPYVSVVGAGSAGLLMPNQWGMMQKLWVVPDTVQDFTSYAIANDIFAITPAGTDETNAFRANGTARVRNVMLPESSEHITLPATQTLAEEKAAREWIDAYAPVGPAAVLPEGAPGRLLWAADVWYSVKKHWVTEAQRLIRAKRAAQGPP